MIEGVSWWRDRWPTVFFLGSTGLLAGGVVADAARGRRGRPTGCGWRRRCSASPSPSWRRPAPSCAGQPRSTSSPCWPSRERSGSTSPSPGAMVAVMLASGQLLEARAAARAGRELRLLVERTPRTAAAAEPRDGVTEVPVGGGRAGRPPRRRHRRGRARSTAGSRPRPRRRVGPHRRAAAGASDRPATSVRSGVVNAGPPVDVVADRPRRRVDVCGRRAGSSSRRRPRRRPFVRTADRFAVLFVPLTLAAGGRAWAVAGLAGARRRRARRRDPVPAAAGRPGRRSCRGCPEPRGSASSSRAVRPSRASRPGRSCSSTRPARSRRAARELRPRS